ncbi:unnamed protein product, partial [Amoebophrya sp. A120]|eukprot:GSA120T00024631001.1
MVLTRAERRKRTSGGAANPPPNVSAGAAPGAVSGGVVLAQGQQASASASSREHSQSGVAPPINGVGQQGMQNGRPHGSAPHQRTGGVASSAAGTMASRDPTVHEERRAAAALG